MVITSAFQAEDDGSIPFTRSIKNKAHGSLVFCFSSSKSNQGWTNDRKENIL